MLIARVGGLGEFSSEYKRNRESSGITHTMNIFSVWMTSGKSRNLLVLNLEFCLGILDFLIFLLEKKCIYYFNVDVVV